MQKGADILVKTLFIIYILMVMFFCFYRFSSTDIDLSRYFLGIRLDRYAHFAMFFPYPFIAWLTCRYTSRSQLLRRHAITVTLISGLIFAGMTELFQDWFFPSRQGDVMDFTADSISVISGCLIVRLAGEHLVKFIERMFSRKALIIVVLLTSVTFTSHADSRDSIRLVRQERLFGGEPVKTAVKLNAAAVVGIVNPSVEFRAHKYITVGLEGFGVFYPKGFGKLINGPVVMAMTFVEGRYYPVESFRGFFVGPNIGFSAWTLSKGIHPMYWGSYHNQYQVGCNFMVGLTAGYAFTLTKHWGIEVSVGGGFQNSIYEGHYLSDGSMYIGWNGSSEWLPYKAAVNIVYKW